MSGIWKYNGIARDVSATEKKNIEVNMFSDAWCPSTCVAYHMSQYEMVCIRRGGIDFGKYSLIISFCAVSISMELLKVWV